MRSSRVSLVVLAAAAAIPALCSGPAMALDWSWSSSRVLQTSGAGCGSAVVEAVDARPGAFALQALTQVGARAVGDQTGEVVARVTEIAQVRESGVPGMAFTFTTSDDACAHPDDYVNGWSSEPLRLRISYMRKEHVYFKEFAHRGNRYARERPSSIHGGSDFGWDRIRWSSWGERVAEGRGSYWYDDKSVVPYRRLRSPVRLRLSAPDVCYGRLRYLRMELVLATDRPRPSWIPRRQSNDLTCDEGIYAG